MLVQPLAVNWADSLNRGLLAWWPMRSHGGNVLRDIANHNHGTLTNMENSDWVGGSPTKSMALDFDGSNDYINCGSEISSARYSYALSFWAKPTDSSTGISRVCFSNGNPSSNGYYIRWRDGSWFHTISGITTGTSVTGTVGKWQHVCIFSLGTTTKYLAVNGVVIQSSVTLPNVPSGSCHIGGNNGSSVFPGQIADVRFHHQFVGAAKLYEASRNGYPNQFLSRRVVAKAPAVAATLTAAQGSYTLNGQTVAFIVGRAVVPVRGDYALTGQATGVLYNRNIVLAQGSYALNGQAAAFTVGRSITAGQGSYACNGQSVGLKVGRAIAPAQGSYSLNGQAVGLTTSTAAELTANQGSYALTGQTVGLSVGRSVAAAQGSYALNGQAATFPVTRAITAAQGSYALNGQTTSIVTARKLAFGQGSYALTGQTSGLALARALTAMQGSYALNGQIVTLTWAFDARLIRSKSAALTRTSATGSMTKPSATATFKVTNQ